jgi:hypothetical protein
MGGIPADGVPRLLASTHLQPQFVFVFVFVLVGLVAERCHSGATDWRREVPEQKLRSHIRSIIRSVDYVNRMGRQKSHRRRPGVFGDI